MMTSLQSHAEILLQKELFKLKKLNLQGVHLNNVHNDSILNWKVKINGKQGCYFQDSEFEILLNFTHEYNSQPPTVLYAEVPFHPCVSPKTETVLLKCLHNWDTNRNVLSILVELQDMLSTVNPITPFNKKAASLLKSSPKIFKKAAGKFREAQKEKEQIVSKAHLYHKIKDHTSKPLKPISQPLSFEAYRRDWMSLGTTNNDMRLNENEINEKESFPVDKNESTTIKKTSSTLTSQENDVTFNELLSWPGSPI